MIPSHPTMFVAARHHAQGDAPNMNSTIEIRILLMSSLIHPNARPISARRSMAISALMGTAIFSGVLMGAPVDSAAQPLFQMTQATAPQHPAAAAATETKGETIEQRIATLHKALKITTDQDAKWKSVADAMRQNAVAMDKVIAETAKKPAQEMTALNDLNTYRKFAQAHVDGLKNLIDDFKPLYDSMPAPQKKNADDVFKAPRA